MPQDEPQGDRDRRARESARIMGQEGFLSADDQLALNDQPEGNGGAADGQDSGHPPRNSGVSPGTDVSVGGNLGRSDDAPTEGIRGGAHGGGLAGSGKDFDPVENPKAED
jgi:hypothetical protein